VTRAEIANVFSNFADPACKPVVLISEGVLCARVRLDLRSYSWHSWGPIAPAAEVTLELAAPTKAVQAVPMASAVAPTNRRVALMTTS
jgi:hypothetical protein